MAARNTYGCFPSALLLAVALVLTVPAVSQGVPGEPQPPPPQPKQEPPKTGGQGGSGVSTGVGINVGDVIGLFRKHAKVHLDAAPQQTQVGDFIAFSTKVSPNADGLTYEYHWSKDKNATGEPERVANINHAYNAPGDYKAWVVVYKNGQKVATSNEVKINVQPPVVVKNVPPPDKVPTPIRTEPTPVPVQNPPTSIANGNTGSKPPATTQVPKPPTKVEQPPPVTTEKPRPPVIQKPPVELPKTASNEPANTGTTPSTEHQKIEYTLSLESNPRSETGKPVDFRAELKPEPPPTAHVRYCFYWGDGEPVSCQSAPMAVHEYRSKGRYLAAVEAFADEESVASRAEKLAISNLVQIDAIAPVWITILPYVAGLLAVVVAAYIVHRIRKMLRFTVTVIPGVGQHTIAPDVHPGSDVLRIRCVRSGIRSQVVFADEPKRTAHV